MNHQQFNKLLDKYQDRLYRLIRSRAKSDEDAEDILQVVLLKIYKKYQQFEHKSELNTWFYMICSNSITDYYRNVWWKFSWFNFSKEGQQAKNQEPEERLMIKEEQGKMNNLVLALPEREQEVFKLRFFDNFNLQDIADCQGISLSTAKTHLYRAVTKVRNGLGGPNYHG